MRAMMNIDDNNKGQVNLPVGMFKDSLNIQGGGKGIQFLGKNVAAKGLDIAGDGFFCNMQFMNKVGDQNVNIDTFNILGKGDCNLQSMNSVGEQNITIFDKFSLKNSGDQTLTSV